MRLLLVALSCLYCAPAAAHNFWLEPERFWLEATGTVPILAYVGHAADQRSILISDGPKEWIVNFQSISSSGTIDRQVQSDIEDGKLVFSTPGTHVLALETKEFKSELPADEFTAYLEKEGLTAASRWREATGMSGDPGREIYSRRAKALVQVDDPDAPSERVVTAPIGHTLEIVPERSPYLLGVGEALPIRVLYQGHPLAGALVTLTDLDTDKPVASARTKADGRASFELPRQGNWLLNVIWTRPLEGHPEADFHTTFASLTFGFLHRPS